MYSAHNVPPNQTDWKWHLFIIILHIPCVGYCYHRYRCPSCSSCIFCCRVQHDKKRNGPFLLSLVFEDVRCWWCSSVCRGSFLGHYTLHLLLMGSNTMKDNKKFIKCTNQDGRRVWDCNMWTFGGGTFNSSVDSRSLNTGFDISQLAVRCTPFRQFSLLVRSRTVRISVSALRYTRTPSV